MSDLLMNMQRQRLRAVPAKLAHEQTAYASFSSNSTQASEQTNATTANDIAAVANRADNDVAAAGAANADDEDGFANILSLKLRKPKHWKWELSTSRSCSNIALPRILLYDHKGALLVDANSQQEQIYAPPVESKAAHKYAGHAATANLAQSIRQALAHEFNGLQIAEATPSPFSSSASTPLPSNHRTPHAIDFNTFELPDFKHERRSNSLRGVRFKDDYQPGATQSDFYNVMHIPTPPSTSTTTTTTPTTRTPTTASNSSAGPREKRRFRRTQSSSRSPAQSESILERFSYNRGRFSSPEYAEEQQLYQAPRYYLRTSKAGTLIVQEDSFSRYRRRRRPRHSSSDNLHNSSNNQSMNSIKSTASQQSVANLVSPPGTESQATKPGTRSRSRRRAQQPIRRYCSDANILTNPSPSSSEDEQLANATIDSHQTSNLYAPHKRKSKRDLVRLDSGVSSAYTAR